MTAVEDLARAIDARERRDTGIKPDNEARIVLAEGMPSSRLTRSVVYLHGFSASQGEGVPAHRAIARACGAHLYLARLSGHGSDAPEALAGASPEVWREDARAALRVGLALGERVVLVGTSMGASLALDLAATYPESVEAVIAWSPGIRAHDPQALQAVVALDGAVTAPGSRSPFQQRYWSSMVHTDGYRAIARLFVERMRDESLGRVVCPVFVGLWDGGEGDRDTLTSVAAMREAFGWLGTPGSHKRLVAYDHAAHALACPDRSPAAARVLADSLAFLHGTGLTA